MGSFTRAALTQLARGGNYFKEGKATSCHGIH